MWPSSPSSKHGPRDLRRPHWGPRAEGTLGDLSEHLPATTKPGPRHSSDRQFLSAPYGVNATQGAGLAEHRGHQEAAASSSVLQEPGWAEGPGTGGRSASHEKRTERQLPQKGERPAGRTRGRTRAPRATPGDGRGQAWEDGVSQGRASRRRCAFPRGVLSLAPKATPSHKSHTRSAACTLLAIRPHLRNETPRSGPRPVSGQREKGS